MVEDTYKFRSGYRVKVSLTDNPSQITYKFIDNNKIEVSTMTSGLPTHMSDRSGFVKELKHCINPTGKVPEQDLRKIKTHLQKMVSALQGEAELKLIQEQQMQME